MTKTKEERERREKAFHYFEKGAETSAKGGLFRPEKRCCPSRKTKGKRITPSSASGAREGKYSARNGPGDFSSGGKVFVKLSKAGELTVFQEGHYLGTGHAEGGRLLGKT